MKINIQMRLMLTVFTLVFALNAHAQESYTLKSSKSSIQGTSSLHDWESEITKAEYKGVFQFANNAVKSIPSAEIKIPVKGIKSTKGKTMDNKTYDAFLYKKNPYITFTLATTKLNAGVSGTTLVTAAGNLTMAGVTKPITLDASLKVLPNGELQLTATKKLKMTEFKMEKPTALMGTIVVGDEVTINIDFVLTTTPEHAKK